MKNAFSNYKRGPKLLKRQTERQVTTAYTTVYVSHVGGGGD